MPLCPHCHLPPQEGCEGSGFLVSSDEPCPQAVAFRASQERAKRLGELAIPERYKNATAAGYEVLGDARRAAAKLAAVAWWEEWKLGRPERGIYFHGPPGSGKTHLAVACLRGVVKDYGATGAFVSLPGLAAQLRERVGEKRSGGGLLAPVLSREVVVLDEIGAQRATEWLVEVLYLVVNTRYSGCRPTLFTSEVPAGKLKLPERLVSRVVEMAEGVSLEGCLDWRRGGK